MVPTPRNAGSLQGTPTPQTRFCAPGHAAILEPSSTPAKIVAMIILVRIERPFVRGSLLSLVERKMALPQWEKAPRPRLRMTEWSRGVGQRNAVLVDLNSRADVEIREN